MASLDLAQALDLAQRAAASGAQIAMQKRQSSEELVIDTKEVTDYVTDVDHAAQAAIITMIQSEFPDHRILAEERGAENMGNPSSSYCWIIDPLDGTKVYVHGKDEFGCLIALQKDDHTVVGVSVLPVKGETYWAVRGKGAFLNGKPVTKLRPTRDLDDAILCTNMGGKSRGTDKIMTFTHPRCASLQNYGCAGFEIAEILKRGNDGVFFDGVHLWDIAPGCLMVEEAGGKSRIELMDPQNPRGGVRCVASTAPIFDELCEFVFK